MYTSKTTNAVEKTAASKSRSFFAPVQPKLAMNAPGDAYETEADAVAEQVVQSKQQPGGLFFKPVKISALQRKCAHCEEEEKKAQRKEHNNSLTEAPDTLSPYIEGLNGAGAALPGAARNFFESKMGYDFSNVKVHTDSVAAKSAQSLDALAYTTGNNIVFNEGQYQPGTDSGKKLLAHELTHVVQQAASAQRPVQRQVAPSPVIPAATLGWQIVNSVLSSSGNDVQVTCDEMVGIFYRSGIPEAQKASPPPITSNYHVFNFRLGSFLFNSDLILLRIGMNYETNELGIGNISFSLIETDDSSAGWEGSFNLNLTPLDEFVQIITTDRVYSYTSGVRLVVNYQASGWIGSASGSIVYEIYSVPGSVHLIRKSGEMEQSHRRG